MPYQLRKQKGKIAIVKSSTGEVVGHSDSVELAKASIRARMAGEHGWKPKRKK